MRKSLGAVALSFLILVPGLGTAREVVIAALGDSLTQGYGLPADQGFVPQLETWLRAQGAEVRLINAGVSGDTTAGGLSRVAWTLTPEVEGMIVTLGGNDLLRGLRPEDAERNLTGIMQAAQAAEVEVLLIGMEAPGNYGPDYKETFDAIYPTLAAEFDSLFLESFFVGLQVDGQTPDLNDLRAYFQADGIHPNAQGVAKIVEGVGPKVLELIRNIEE